MNVATIQRDQVGPPGSTTPTLGRWTMDGADAPLCQTLELPDNGNAHMISCIPSGTFPFAYRYSEKHGRDIWHIDVPDRDNIEVHIGNTIKDTDGCVLVGLGRDGQSITQSHAAFDALYEALGVEENRADLTITVLNP